MEVILCKNGYLKNKNFYSYSAEATKALANAISYFLKKDGECFVANHIIRVNKLEEKFINECLEKKLKVEFQGFIDKEEKIKLHKVTKE